MAVVCSAKGSLIFWPGKISGVLDDLAVGLEDLGIVVRFSVELLAMADRVSPFLMM